MGENSKIQWCHHTFNPWIGCQKVSAECDHCYAHDNTFVRTQRKEGRELWGNTLRSDRHVTSAANWRKPLAWDRAAAEAGERHRVFCASLADVFEDRDDLQDPRDAVFELIEATPNLDWLLLTKRPENVMAMVPESWREAFPHQVWLGTSVGTQAAADERIPHLLRCPAAVRFLSCEPLLGPVDLENALQDGIPTQEQMQGDRGLHYIRHGAPRVHWVIAGGESGPNARSCDLGWIRRIVEQCAAAGVPCFVKQLGAVVHDRNDAGFDAYMEVDTETGLPTFPTAWPEPLEVEHDVRGFREEYQGVPVRMHLQDRKGGDPSEWPKDLRVRQFPELQEETT